MSVLYPIYVSPERFRIIFTKQYGGYKRREYRYWLTLRSFDPMSGDSVRCLKGCGVGNRRCRDGVMKQCRALLKFPCQMTSAIYTFRHLLNIPEKYVYCKNQVKAKIIISACLWVFNKIHQIYLQSSYEKKKQVKEIKEQKLK